MISALDQVLFLQKVSIFADLSIEELGTIAGITSNIEIDEDEILFKEGDVGDKAYIIISGQVVIYREEQKHLTIIDELGTGDCFGEMAILDNFPRSASAKATQKAILIVYQRDALLDIISHFPNIALGIIRVVSRRFRENIRRLSQYELLLTDYDAVNKKYHNLIGHRKDQLHKL